jgi:hypothetical protein
VRIREANVCALPALRISSDRIRTQHANVHEPSHLWFNYTLTVFCDIWNYSNPWTTYSNNLHASNFYNIEIRGAHFIRVKL